MLRILRLLLAALLLAIAAATPASARMHAPYRGHRIIQNAVPPPLDGLTAPSGAYSFRKLKSTYAGPAIRLRRASDNLETDINFLGCTGFTGCPWDEAAATSHCAATTCSIVTLYDQSGNSRHMTNATQATQPQLIFSCRGALPCFRSISGSLLFSSNFTPATGVASLNAVAARTVGTGQCIVLRENGPNNKLGGRGGAGGFQVTDSASAAVLTIIPEGAWHAVIGVLNGASSTITAETGTPGSGTLAGNTTPGGISINGAGSTTCDQGEAILWDNYVLTAGETAALIANQRSFWGF